MSQQSRQQQPLNPTLVSPALAQACDQLRTSYPAMQTALTAMAKEMPKMNAAVREQARQLQAILPAYQALVSEKQASSLAQAWSDNLRLTSPFTDTRFLQQTPQIQGLLVKMQERSIGAALGEQMQQLASAFQGIPEFARNAAAALEGIREFTDRMESLSAFQRHSSVGLDLARISAFGRIEEKVWESLRIQHLDLAQQLGRLVIAPEHALRPAFVISGATREVLTATYASHTLIVDTDTPERDDVPASEFTLEEREVAACIDLLQQCEPRLVILYRGAHEAFRGGSVDRHRHVLISLRELWMHLLQRLAPDAAVLPWVPPERRAEYLNNGRPTRSARIAYLARGLRSDPLAGFLKKDTGALVELMELFQKVHELTSPLSDRQLEALLLRTNCWLLYVLRIWRMADGS